MEIIPDKQRYTVGDTATLLVASPFTDVEALLTIECERVLESRRMRITAGATTIKLPITEALAPNAFVSVPLVRGRSGQPGPLDDPGSPTMRVGCAELRVVPAVKQLKVEIAPVQPEYRPGDTARVNLQVTDAAGIGQRSEVTLWAVDEGVLALTSYQTPDPVDSVACASSRPSRHRTRGASSSRPYTCRARSVASPMTETMPMTDFASGFGSGRIVNTITAGPLLKLLLAMDGMETPEDPQQTWAVLRRFAQIPGSSEQDVLGFRST
jgi:hypothetical protein